MIGGLVANGLGNTYSVSHPQKGEQKVPAVMDLSTPKITF